MMEDAELLRRYAEEKSEAAFAELVRRHVDLVYGVAHRQVGGDAHLAQDVTQVVFAALARKAAGLADRPVLAGWLHRSAQFAAIDVVRAEQRRRAREEEAYAMTDHLTLAENSLPDWEKLRPLLDRTIAELGEQDRDAVVLRFFNSRSFADIGASLRLTENAARMRVERALEKLRAQLKRHGVTSTTAALSAGLVHQAGIAAPAGLAAAVTGATLGAAAATTAGSWLIGFMGMTKLQMGIAGAVALVGAAAYVSEGRAHVALRQEIAQVNARHGMIAALRVENGRLAETAAEIEMLRRDDAELERLARGVAVAKQQAEARRIAAAKAPPLKLPAKSPQERRAEYEAKLRADELKVQEEVARLNQQGAALVREYYDLSRRAQDTSLAPEVRGQAEAAAQAKADQIKKRQQELRTFVGNTRQSLEQRAMTFYAVLARETGETPPPNPAYPNGSALNPTTDPASDLANPKFGLENSVP